MTISYDGQGEIWGTTIRGALRLDPDTAHFTEYHSVTETMPNGGIGSSYGIAGTADGNAWWTEMAFDTIEKSDIKTGKTTEWKLPPVAEEVKLANEADHKFYATYGPKDIGTPFPWSQGPRRIGIDRDLGLIWVADSWGGNLLRIDTKTAEMKFIPFPSPATEQPYHAVPDTDHNVWASMWTTDQIAKYEPATGTMDVVRPADARHRGADHFPSGKAGPQGTCVRLCAIEQGRGDDVPQRSRRQGSGAGGSTAMTNAP